MSCRPAWPSMFTGLGLPKNAPIKTVNSSRLPIIPTGHAHTLRRIPPSADARPNALPRTSRTSRDWSPTWICASKSHRRNSIFSLSSCRSRRLRGEQKHAPTEPLLPGGTGYARHCRRARRRVWARPPLFLLVLPTIQTVLSAPEFHRFGRAMPSHSRCGSRTITAGSEFHRPRSTIERLNYRTPEREDSHGARPQPGTLRTGSRWGAYPAAHRRRIRGPSAPGGARPHAP